MKLRINRQEMADVLTAICSVTSIRTPKDVLKCVHMEAKSDVLLLSATDLELALRCAVTQVEVDKPGEALVVADTLNRIVRECTDEILFFDTSGSQLNVRGQGSHFQIVTQSAADFPPVPTMEGEPGFTVELGALRRAIEWTTFAAARESTRYAINGVLWEIQGDKLTLVATDGRRLSVAHVKMGNVRGGPVNPSIVPVKALTLLGRLPADADMTVAVKLTANQAHLKVGAATLSSNLVEGHFPDYRRVIPEDCDRESDLKTAEFQSALRRAALLTNEESKGVRLSFEDGTLTLSSRAPEQGEATISLPVHYRGDKLEIAFNPVFLSDMLRAVHSEDIRLLFRNSNRPGLIRLEDGFLHVIMPVNL